MPTFKTWFENTSALSIYEDTLLIATPNAFAKEWLESRYSSLLKQAVTEIMGEQISIKFVIKGNNEEPGKPNEVTLPLSQEPVHQAAPCLQ